MKQTVITGAGRGLGLEFAKQCLERGDTVFATARHPDGSDGLTALSGAHGARLKTIPLDVGDTQSINACFETIKKATTSLDLLINNAGVNSTSMPKGQGNVSFGLLNPDGLVEMIRINAVAPIMIGQRFVSLLEADGGGRIVNISSWLGSIGNKDHGGNYGYCASKATLNMLGRTMAHDLASVGVTTVMVNPGWVQTDMGGNKAPLTPAQSVGGILGVVDGLTPKDNGSFLQWDGSPHPW